MALEWTQNADGHWNAGVGGFAYFHVENWTPPEWTVEVFGYATSTILNSGRCDTLESAKLAAVEAWRRWARETAEAAGFVVTDPVEPEVGGDG